MSINTWSQNMILEFNTTVSSGTTVTLPLYGAVDVTVDWGDGGGTENFTTEGNKDHIYGEEGTYFVAITGSLDHFGSADYPNADKLISVSDWGNLGLIDLSYTFHNAVNLTSVPTDIPVTVTHTLNMFYNATTFNQDISTWNVSSVIDMSSMFRQATNFNQNIGNWDVSNVTNMQTLFMDASAFNQDIGNWIVSNVTSMHYMFSNATSFNQDIGRWNVSNVNAMTNMFENVTLSTENYDALLFGWSQLGLQMGVSFHAGNSKYSDVVSKDILLNEPYNWGITDGGIDETTQMVLEFNTQAPGATLNKTITIELQGTVSVFVEWGDGYDNTYTTAGNYDHIYVSEGTYTVTITGSLTHFGSEIVTNEDKLISVTSWGELGLTDLSYAFADSHNLTQVPSNVPTTVTNMRGMFLFATIFNQDISSWDVSQVINMDAMFYFATAFNQNIGNWDVSQVTDMSVMFHSANAFNQDIGNWNVSSVTNMSHMFEGASAFDQNIGNWDVSNVTDMNYMFSEAILFNQDIGSWNVGSVTDMHYMFNCAFDFNQDIGSWNVSNVTDMARMFINATSFNQDIGNWNVGSVLNMNSMLCYAYAFNQDIGNWNVSNVSQMQYMLGDVILSTDNYDALLIGWSEQTLQPNVDFYGGNSQYTAVDARAVLTETYNWTITDAGRLDSDFGDLPTEYNNTLIIDNGACHFLSSTNQIMLGANIDTESNGAVSSSADEDDYDDGIQVVGEWEEGTDGGVIEVIVTGGDGYLSGWIDWNEDQDFADDGEQILDQRLVTQYTQTITFDIPAGGTATQLKFARFRLFKNNPNTYTTTGCVTNGEVEDYQLTFTVATNFVITSFSPINEATSVNSVEPIIVEFNLTPNIATINSTTFNVEGSVSGEIFGTYDIDERTLSFSPDKPYGSGENITVTITGITSANGLELNEVYTSTFTTEVVEPPVITSQPQNIELCAGINSIFNVVAVKNGDLSYEWQEDSGAGFITLNDDETYNGLNTNELTISNTSHLLNTYQYRCLVANEAGTAISDTATLTVNGQLAVTGDDYAFYSDTYPVPTIDDLVLTADDLNSGASGWWTTTAVNVSIENSLSHYTYADGLTSGKTMFKWTISKDACTTSDSLQITIGTSFIPSTYTVTWNNAENWIPPAVPTANDSVTIYDAEVSISGIDVACDQLFIGTGSELFISSSAKGAPGTFTTNSVIIQQDIDKFPNLRGNATLNIGSGGTVIIRQDIDKKQSRGSTFVVGSGGTVIIRQDIDKDKTEPATLILEDGNNIIVQGTDPKQPKVVANLNIGNGGSVIIRQDIDKKTPSGNLIVGNNGSVIIQQDIDKSNKGGENLILHGGSVIIRQDIDKANYNDKGANFTITGGSVIIQQDIDKGGAGNFEVGNGGSVKIQQDIDKGNKLVTNLDVGVGGSVIIRQDIDKNLKGNANLDVRGGSVIIRQDIDKGSSGSLQIGNGGSVIIRQDIDKSFSGDFSTPKVEITNGELILGNVGVKAPKGTASLRTNQVIIRQDIDKAPKADSVNLYIASNGDISFNEENGLLYSEFIYLDSLSTMTIDDGGQIIFDYPEHNKFTIENGASIIDANDITLGNNAKYINGFSPTSTKFFSVPVQGETSSVFDTEIVYNWTENTATWDEFTGQISPISGYKTLFSVDTNLAFTGQLVSGNQTCNLTANTELPFIQRGWNFIGNPYPSYLDFNLIDFTNIAPVKYTYNEVTNSFEIYIQGGTSLNGGTQYVKDGQGFFVKATEDGTFDFTNIQRLHFFNQVKQEPKTDGDLITLKLTDENLTKSDYTNITFDETATENYDFETDAPAIALLNPELLAFCMITPNNEELSINSMSSPGEETKIYNMYFNAPEAGNYTISVEELTIEAGITVHLNDNELEVITDLHSVSEYTFTAEQGVSTDRFTLHFNDDFVNINEDKEMNENISIYSYGNTIYVNNKVDENYTVEVYDVLGMKIMEGTISGKGLNSFEMNNASNCYIVKVKTANYFISKSLFVW